MQGMGMKGLDYIQRKEIDHKEVTETELTLRVCPFCGDDRHKFYVNKESGLYDCKICAQQGNLYQLQAKFGDLDSFTTTKALVNKTKYKPLSNALMTTAIEELWKSQEAINYLYSRGFNDETIKHFKIGLIDFDWISIPHIHEKKLWNFKQRNYRAKDFRRIAGQPTVLFNSDDIDKTNALLIVESETDCMAAWQMGITNVIALTGGAQGFKPEWMPFFNDFKEVYICLNADDAGQRGAYKVAEKVGLPKCKNVILPTNDVNDYLKDEKYTSQSFKELLNDKAIKFSIKNITSLEEYMEVVDDWYDGDGAMAGMSLEDFPQLNKILNGFKAEDLIVLSGDSGVGKTTLTLNMALQFIKQEYNCLGFCLEGKLMYYVLRMMGIQVEKNINDLREFDEEWENLKDEFSEYPLYFYSGSQAELTPKKLKELLPAVVKLYSIDFVIIDNLQKFVRGTDNRAQHVSEAVSMLKDLAVDLKIPILLISHIVKKGKNDNSKITMHDAKESSTIYQDADIYLIIDTDKDDNYEIVVEKNRMGEGNVRIPYALSKETGKYYESNAVPSKGKVRKDVVQTEGLEEEIEDAESTEF